MRILWDSYGISLWFLCYFHVISKYIIDLSMGFLWDLYDISRINQLNINSN